MSLVSKLLNTYIHRCCLSDALFMSFTHNKKVPAFGEDFFYNRSLTHNANPFLSGYATTSTYLIARFSTVSEPLPMVRVPVSPVTPEMLPNDSLYPPLKYTAAWLVRFKFSLN